MLLLLLAAASVYHLIGDLTEALILAASIIVVIAISVGQRARTERALEALRDLSSPRAQVVRDGGVQRIAGAEVVRGDLLLLSEGDRVAADARLVEASDLTADESLLTGESLAVEKYPSGAGHAGTVFSGTMIVRGHGRAEVTATGPRSELGRIGGMLAAIEPEKTSLEIQTGRIVRRVAAFAVALSALVALLHVLLRGGWVESILAGLTLAMAILPEEYPVVLTVFLALGAWRIARRDVLTRRMPAIETLGAATVLCVDKTGTLTENRMAVKEVLAGEERAVLAHAALASELAPFDPMDNAILATAAERAPEAVEWAQSLAARPRLLAERGFSRRVPCLARPAAGWSSLSRAPPKL
jgi:Ca2+-transporting ATPase